MPAQIYFKEHQNRRKHSTIDALQLHIKRAQLQSR